MKVGILVVFFFVLALTAACATMQAPGNPANSWLNGKWFAVRGGSGWTTELDLTVVDGNKVIGTNIQTGPDGRRWFGDVSGMVEGDKVSLEVYLPRSGNTHAYTLLRKEGVLDGRSTTGRVSLKKAS